ncbi:MAG: Nif3-like dinuclear metal center hexameric protein [Fibrobacterota bacterium]
MDRDRICRELSQLLNVDCIDDYAFNGLQVEGVSEVSTIAFAVDSGCEVFERAVEIGADMLIVHHGLFWKKADPSFRGVMKRRIEILQKAGISLYAVHLPLDIHDRVGNNTALLSELAVTSSEGFSRHGAEWIGRIGTLSVPRTAEEIRQEVDSFLGTESSVILPENTVHRVAVFTGAGGRGELSEALSCGADLLITGEEVDFYHDARDAQCSVIFAGHHGTEQAGIWALQQYVQEKYTDLATHFIDIKTFL